MAIKGVCAVAGCCGGTWNWSSTEGSGGWKLGKFDIIPLSMWTVDKSWFTDKIGISENFSSLLLECFLSAATCPIWDQWGLFYSTLNTMITIWFFEKILHNLAVVPKNKFLWIPVVPEIAILISILLDDVIQPLEASQPVMCMLQQRVAADWWPSGLFETDQIMSHVQWTS